ncbi:MAG: translation initiation factor IF-3 [bacterium]|jgi:translation initiation factor IF-3
MEVLIAAPRSKRFSKRNEPQTRVNQAITAARVRVIDDDGTQLGILSIEEALDLSSSKGIDLVEVSKNAVPPVCRVMDYGKYKYEEKKKQHLAKQKQKVIQIKEIKLRPKTETHDFNFKTKHAQEFLEDGNKVKVTVMFRGREMAYQSMGIALLQKFADAVQEQGVIEQAPKSVGRTALMILVPKK